MGVLTKWWKGVKGEKATRGLQLVGTGGKVMVRIGGNPFSSVEAATLPSQILLDPGAG
jgi:hypothetical protein